MHALHAKTISAWIFDWGNTIMKDSGLPGPMYRWDQVEWVKGAEELLILLKSSYILAIATSAEHSGTQEMIAALQRINAHRYFHHFFSSREIGFYKPDPRFFSHIAERPGIAPNQCIAVGDSYEKDIIAARKAGMNTVFFNPKHLSGSFSLADVVISDMTELIQFVHPE